MRYTYKADRRRTPKRGDFVRWTTGTDKGDQRVKDNGWPDVVRRVRRVEGRLVILDRPGPDGERAWRVKRECVVVVKEVLQ